MARFGSLPFLATLAILLVPNGAPAATCADHPNQASAQAAADTRDADGDGIYCEPAVPVLDGPAGGFE